MKQIQKYLVGGAVRDILLGMEPKDRDYVVIGETVESMEARGFKQVGKDFPVFLHPETGEEYALARRERKTGNGYNGFSVETNDVTLEADSQRRDLTINSIAMDVETGEIIDPFGGKDDLENGILRHTSDAFSEDPLRVIRLARFRARYDFTIAPETMELAKNIVQSGEMNHISTERYWVELEKAFSDTRPDMFLRVLRSMGVFEHVKFFQIMMGDVTSDEFHEIVGSVCYATGYSSEVRLAFFMAMMAYYNPTITMFPNARASKLAIATKYMRLQWNKDDKTGEQLYALLILLGAYREGTTFNDFIEFMNVFDFPDSKLTGIMVSTALDRSRVVQSSMFPDLEGKELGMAISNARKNVVQYVY